MSKNWPDGYEQMEEGRESRAQQLSVLEEILNNAILIMYHKLGGGYYGKRLGRIEVKELEFGKMGIMYIPSEIKKAEGFQEGVVAIINLQNKTYTVQWNGNKQEHKTLPYVVMDDTDHIMSMLEIRKKE